MRLEIVRNCFVVFSFWCVGVFGNPLNRKGKRYSLKNLERRKISSYTEPWAVNKDVCPPSLCVSSDAVDARPRGTGGSIFYNGDIILDSYTADIIFGKRQSYRRRRVKRALAKNKKKLWPKGIVPYSMSSDISVAAKKVLQRSMRHIQRRTCIRFKQKTVKDQDYVRLISEPGCWSEIGRTGGEQKLSLGGGCEYDKTGIHELLHTLGVWHEMSRPDRDKYVKVVIKNVAKRYVKDFEKLNKTIINPRGYAYDYQSIMHYGPYAFADNIHETIKVIGPGLNADVKIGQATGLSTIDIAQLNELYKCHHRSDAKNAVCPKGWVKFRRSCYKFFQFPKFQFAAAQRQCEKFNSHLVFIESRTEEKFLTNRIRNKYKYTYTWRTGGRRINKTMMWYRNNKQVPKRMKYTNWAKKWHSNGYTSTLLALDTATNTYAWEGEWLGSRSQLPHYMHSFICEKPAKRKCFNLKSKNGIDYRGNIDHTEGGITCQKWTEQYPHKQKITSKLTDGIGNHNFCRNPKQKQRKRPWCYTTKASKVWQYCDVRAC